MVQIYFLTELYLALGAMYLLSDKYAGTYYPFLWVKMGLSEHKRPRVIAMFAGFILSALLVFFPFDPGPRFLGDLIPSVSVFSVAIYFLYGVIVPQKIKSEAPDESSILEYTGTLIERNKTFCGRALIAVAALHFLFPRIILI